MKKVLFLIAVLCAALFIVLDCSMPDTSKAGTSSALAVRASASGSITYSGGGDADRYQSLEIDTDGDGQLNFIVETNVWNITSASGTIVMTYNNGLTVDIDLSNIQQEDADGWVHAYPEIWYGAKPWNTLGPVTDGPVPLPRKLSELNDFTTTVTYSMNRTDSGTPYNFPLETWLTRDTNRGENAIQSNEIELMIWLDGQGLQGFGSQVGTFTSGGRTYNVYRSGAVSDPGWEGIAFTPVSPQSSGTVTIQWGPFIQEARKYSDRPDWEDLYFTAVEIGTEFGSPDYLQAGLEWSLSQFTLEYGSTPILGEGPTPTPTSTPTPTPTPTITPTPTSTPTPTAGIPCDNPTSISIPFTQDGAGEFCWSFSDTPLYINSWNLAELSINGVVYTNKWVSGSNLPAKIDGLYYVYYRGNYRWSHAEIANPMSPTPTPTSTPTPTPTITPTPTSTPTPTPTAGIPCDNPTSISIPFTQDGAGEFCWSFSSTPNFINSWNLAELSINGVDYTNKWVSGSNLPAKIDGLYYVYCRGNYRWSHVEIR
jgi:endoglucanase